MPMNLFEAHHTYHRRVLGGKWSVSRLVTNANDAIQVRINADVGNNVGITVRLAIQSRESWLEPQPSSLIGHTAKAL